MGICIGIELFQKAMYGVWKLAIIDKLPVSQSSQGSQSVTTHGQTDRTGQQIIWKNIFHVSSEILNEHSRLGFSLSKPSKSDHRRIKMLKLLHSWSIVTPTEPGVLFLLLFLCKLTFKLSVFQFGVLSSKERFLLSITCGVSSSSSLQLLTSKPMHAQLTDEVECMQYVLDLIFRLLPFPTHHHQHLSQAKFEGSLQPTGAAGSSSTSYKYETSS